MTRHSHSQRCSALEAPEQMLHFTPPEIIKCQSDWRRPVGRPHSSWMATLKNDLSLHNLTYEDAIEMALDKPLWGLLAASEATH